MNEWQYVRSIDRYLFDQYARHGYSRDMVEVLKSSGHIVEAVHVDPFFNEYVYEVIIYGTRTFQVTVNTAMDRAKCIDFVEPIPKSACEELSEAVDKFKEDITLELIPMVDALNEAVTSLKKILHMLKPGESEEEEK